MTNDNKGEGLNVKKARDKMQNIKELKTYQLHGSSGYVRITVTSLGYKPNSVSLEFCHVERKPDFSLSLTDLKCLCDNLTKHFDIKNNVQCEKMN